MAVTVTETTGVAACAACGGDVSRDSGLLLVDADVIDDEGGPLDAHDELCVPAYRVVACCSWPCVQIFAGLHDGGSS